MTLLASVASVYQKLRDLPPESISTGLSDQTIVGFLNEAASEVLNTFAWSFLKRYDGKLFLPAPFEADTAGSIVDGETDGALNITGGNAWSTADVHDFSGPATGAARVCARILWTGETVSYRITELSTAALFPYTQADAYRGAGHILEGWTIFAHEYVLPDTVRQVLSVYDQDRELTLCMEDRDLDLIASQPRDSSLFGDPDRAFVGGALTATGNDAGSTTQTGLGLTVYPPPDADKFLDYSYIYRHPLLSADTDSWAGVPAEVVSLSEWWAFEKALDSNVEDDPDRSAKIRAKNEATLARLQSADSRMIYRRHVPREIGRRRDWRNPRARWGSQVIPSP